MEELEKPNLYSTASHNNELDFIFNQDSEDFDEIVFNENRDFLSELKTYFRLFRKKFCNICIAEYHLTKIPDHANYN